MKLGKTWKNIVVGCALVASLAATGCTATQTEEGKLPDVDVTAKEGNLPKYDVDVADVDVKTEKKQVDMPNVDVGTETKTVEVEVPDVDVNTEKTSVTVPDVDVTMPGDKKTP